MLRHHGVIETVAPFIDHTHGMFRTSWLGFSPGRGRGNNTTKQENRENGQTTRHGQSPFKAVVSARYTGESLQGSTNMPSAPARPISPDYDCGLPAYLCPCPTHQNCIKRHTIQHNAVNQQHAWTHNARCSTLLPHDQHDNPFKNNFHTIRKSAAILLATQKNNHQLYSIKPPSII